MRQRFIPSSEDLSPHRRANFVIVARVDDLVLVLIEPAGELAPLLAGQAQDFLFKLIQAHGDSLTGTWEMRIENAAMVHFGRADSSAQFLASGTTARGG